MTRLSAVVIVELDFKIIHPSKVLKHLTLIKHNTESPHSLPRQFHTRDNIISRGISYSASVVISFRTICIAVTKLKPNALLLLPSSSSINNLIIIMTISTCQVCREMTTWIASYPIHSCGRCHSQFEANISIFKKFNELKIYCSCRLHWFSSFILFVIFFFFFAEIINDY